MRNLFLFFISVAIIALGLFSIIVEMTISEADQEKNTAEEATLGESTPDKSIPNESISNEISQVVPFELTVKPEVSYPGDTVLVQASQEGWITFNGKLYKLHEGPAGYLTFLPIPIDQKPSELVIQWTPLEKGVLSVKNEVDLKESEESDASKATLTIKEKSFSTQYLTVKKEQEEMRRDTKRIEEDQKKVSQALSSPIEEPLFSGGFLQPLEGRVSTMFGHTRYVNGEFSSRHLAIDIAAPEGTPIIAPANGKVVLAEPLYLSGNRVIIDHGIELYTSFSHLSRLDVQVGDEVEKGDIIGLVGSTGFSTGPHLHHAVYVHGYAVNPELFFGSDPFEWEVID